MAIAHARALDEIEHLKEQLELENTYLREDVRSDARDGMIGGSPALRKVLEQVAIVAPTPATVLIQGESGTGKELVARAIHDRSPRHSRPLIEVNCASIPRELFESEFFGHVKGAFTGALRDRAGRFQAATGGTLFLDEVGEIRWSCRRSCSEFCRRVSSNASERRLREPSTYVFSRPPTEICSRKWRPAAFVPICSTGSVCFRSSCRHSANGRKTSRNLRHTSSSRRRGATAGQHRDSRYGQSRYSKRTTGLETSGNCSTSLNAPSCCRLAMCCDLMVC